MILKDALWRAAKATTQWEFEQHVHVMEQIDPDAYRWLMAVPSRFWSRHAFRTLPKCDMLLNNLSDTFNAFILESRDKPIIQMLEMMRKAVMRRIVKKRELMLKHDYPICPRISMKLEKNKEVSRHCLATWAGDRRYEVEHGVNQYIVDIDKHECSCFKWQVTGIPCAHAIQCIYFLKRKPEEFVNPYFHKDKYLVTYSYFLQPLNGQNMWPKTNFVPPLPPVVRRPPGRPKRKRRRDEDETQIPHQGRLRRTGTMIRCEKCNLIGHNSRICRGKPVGGNPRQRSSRMTGTSTARHDRQEGQEQGSSRDFMGFKFASQHHGTQV